jgi:hypothetical protein
MKNYFYFGFFCFDIAIPDARVGECEVAAKIERPV